MLQNPSQREKHGLGLQFLIRIQISTQNSGVMPKKGNKYHRTEHKSSNFKICFRSLFGYYQHKYYALLPVPTDYKLMKNNFHI